jgi:3-dehydroquinate dehydratase II
LAYKVLILNGPNLNMLGKREPGIYGAATLDSIASACASKAADLGIEVDFRQSNIEGELVGWIQQAMGNVDCVIINPAAYTHTSVAIHDALRLLDVPVIELHLSNVHAREAFRHHSYVSPVATAILCGFGADGYTMALDGARRLIDKTKTSA